ncbi:hypothetical protein METBIDRAFT_221883 [Metschnikowia bicuspidata var. bicuspidata NRRL YB-4993]|uniref:Heat shock transcription factor n=1 Tax=Metschnikowia bicuspidata var. bicuspidata NRRL YB-4993 TaxID=869754 RepID=A0A1A0H600_9ASCO|nr:hypothetical protein METBIDRAFT_221883 [Metschnikowia bicuspidata var. bicuspidata NRRL YB-4993]OBA19343.1 hypothetical protein METBIDRAFT_221883 [Metschnikowia bicuspidata var. bicuspidata NRRL YB-4993]
MTRANLRSQSTPGKKNAFVYKLYRMLNDHSISHLIWWSGNPRGSAFQLSPSQEFCEALSKYFKHRNVASFVRQLHMYGFHKVSDSLMTQVELGPMLWEFRHASGKFRQGNESLLSHIKRRLQSSSLRQLTTAMSRKVFPEDLSLHQGNYVVPGAVNNVGEPGDCLQSSLHFFQNSLAQPHQLPPAGLLAAPPLFIPVFSAQHNPNFHDPNSGNVCFQPPGAYSHPMGIPPGSGAMDHVPPASSPQMQYMYGSQWQPVQFGPSPNTAPILPHGISSGHIPYYTHYQTPRPQASIQVHVPVYSPSNSVATHGPGLEPPHPDAIARRRSTISGQSFQTPEIKFSGLRSQVNSTSSTENFRSVADTGIMSGNGASPGQFHETGNNHPRSGDDPLKYNQPCDFPDSRESYSPSFHKDSLESRKLTRGRSFSGSKDESVGNAQITSGSLPNSVSFLPRQEPENFGKLAISGTNETTKTETSPSVSKIHLAQSQQTSHGQNVLGPNSSHSSVSSNDSSIPTTSSGRQLSFGLNSQSGPSSFSTGGSPCADVALISCTQVFPLPSLIENSDQVSIGLGSRSTSGAEGSKMRLSNKTQLPRVEFFLNNPQPTLKRPISDE